MIDNLNMQGNIYIGVGYGRKVSTTDFDYFLAPGIGRHWQLAFFGDKIKEKWIVITDVVNLLIGYVETVA